MTLFLICISGKEWVENVLTKLQAAACHLLEDQLNPGPAPEGVVIAAGDGVGAIDEQLEKAISDSDGTQGVLGEVAGVTAGDIEGVLLWISSRIAPEVAQAVVPVQVGDEGVGTIGDRGIEAHQGGLLGIASKDTRVAAHCQEKLGPQVVSGFQVSQVGGGI